METHGGPQALWAPPPEELQVEIPSPTAVLVHKAVLSWGNSPSFSDPAGVGQAQEPAFQLAFQVTLLYANV